MNLDNSLSERRSKKSEKDEIEINSIELDIYIIYITMLHKSLQIL